jgi:hypothetical protein
MRHFMGPMLVLMEPDRKSDGTQSVLEMGPVGFFEETFLEKGDPVPLISFVNACPMGL